MNIIEEKIINDIFTKVITKGEYPNFGSPECKCNKCMFHNVACFPTNKNAVGCFHGWKKEEDEKWNDFNKTLDKIEKIRGDFV